jgi:hypothetical protein
MMRVIQSLNAVAQAKDGEFVDQPKSFTDLITSKGTIGIAIFALIGISA